MLVLLYVVTNDGCRHLTATLAGRLKADVLVEVAELRWVPVRQKLDDDREVFPAPQVDALAVRWRHLVRDFNEQFLIITSIAN